MSFFKVEPSSTMLFAKGHQPGTLVQDDGGDVWMCLRTNDYDLRWYCITRDVDRSAGGVRGVQVKCEPLRIVKC